MTHEPGHGDFEREDELPSGLADDLSSLYRAGGAGGAGGAGDDVPRRVDDAVMAAARERFGAMDVGGRPGGFFVVVRRIGLVGGPLAAAAVLALVVWMTPWRPGVPQGPVPMPGMAKQQARGMLENEAKDRMADDRLAFQEAESAERSFASADKREAPAGQAAGLADETLATLADASGRRDEDAFARKAGRAASGAAQPAAPMLAAEAAPRWAEDFNGDGIVDMRDALMMARVVERGPWSMGMEWDLNGDGVVDARDVHVVALAAVDLERHGEILR